MGCFGSALVHARHSAARCRHRAHGAHRVGSAGCWFARGSCRSAQVGSRCADLISRNLFHRFVKLVRGEIGFTRCVGSNRVQLVSIRLASLGSGVRAIACERIRSLPLAYARYRLHTNARYARLLVSWCARVWLVG